MYDIENHPPIGAIYQAEKKRCCFTVWAPHHNQVELSLGHDTSRIIAMNRLPLGYWQIEVENVEPNEQYTYRLDQNHNRPDPASHWQPQDVHQPSAIVDHTWNWDDQNWHGIPLEKLVIYELHVGTFTREGTFVAIINRLPVLKDLGINALELMPIAQFPGKRNWGYDGVYPFAVQNSYGGHLALKKLVSACHKMGIAVLLDVVYNHLGPEGNYLWDYGPYFTPLYKTPWGEAINFDCAESDGVRHYFYQNVWHWLSRYHIDGLRLDAVNAILDRSPHKFLAELATFAQIWAQQAGRYFHIIAETSQNNPCLIRPQELGGMGLSATWSDDFHHSLHVFFTGEMQDYYQDFHEPQTKLAKAIRCGFSYTGEYSLYRKRRHGKLALDCKTSQFVIFSQNHDQIGNRAFGERLSQLMKEHTWDKQKLISAILLLSPQTPLLFMGEEYGETSPFYYFISHLDQKLIDAVRQGRAEQFKHFNQNNLSDPYDTKTFEASKLHWDDREQGNHAILWRWYQKLLELRRTLKALQSVSFDDCECFCQQDLLFIHRTNKSQNIIVCCNLAGQPQTFVLPTSLSNSWINVLDSTQAQWAEIGSREGFHFERGMPIEIHDNSSLTLPMYGVVVYNQEEKGK